jgi:acetyl esterase/lipase
LKQHLRNREENPMRSAFAKRVAGGGILVAALSLSTICRAQQQVIPLWPGAAPGSESWTQKEETTTLPPMAAGGPLIRNVTQPTLTVFPPDPSKANGTAVIVCPGGGFHFLSWESEGTEVAKWLGTHGIAAFVLKYRLVDTGPTAEDFRKAVMALFNPAASAGRPAGGNGLPESMRKVMPFAIADGRQAVKLVRQRASEWGIAADRIGIMGFSAGGMVTMGVVMEHDADSRPNFAGAIYGAGLWEGAANPPEATPLFILCAADDPIAATGSVATYTKWKAAGYPVELHMYSKGGHGFGMNKQGLPTDHWIERFGDWLEVQGLMKPKH